MKVWRANDPDNFYQLRYWSYDWDNDNVYIFQLDQKRQSTGDTYKMEYVTTSADADGDLIKKSQILELKETYFQSFYVPEGHALTDVYLLSGNTQEGDVKLRMNMEEIHPRIDISSQLDIPKVTQKFGFDKNANREMVRFNWIGTGLFEKYDTLYLKLFDYRGKVVTEANMNVHRVDEKGNYVADNTLRYVGYDKEMEQLISILLKVGNSEQDEYLARFIATAGLLIANLDDDVTKEETDTIIENLASLKIFPMQFLEEMKKTDVTEVFNDAVANLIRLNPTLREGMMNYMISIVMSDKNISKDEVDLLTHYGSKIGFSHMEIANLMAVAIQQRFMPSLDSIW